MRESATIMRGVLFSLLAVAVLSAGCSGDADMDGISDLVDNCPVDANFNQDDTDLDGVGDVCDNCPEQDNPGQEDADLDGEGDACDEGILG